MTNVSLVLDYEPHMRCIVQFHDENIGWCTRNPDGVLVARFVPDDKPFSTDSVDAAYDYSVAMGRRRQNGGRRLWRTRELPYI